MQRAAEITYDLDLLKQSRTAWDRSKGLQYFYGDLYGEVAQRTGTGSILEIGAGIGVGKNFLKDLVTSDVVQTPYVDRAMSAYQIAPPEDDSEWGTIFAIDVLHHLKYPLRFFASAAEVLKDSGQLILIEPSATFGGCLFYRLFHHEPIRPKEILPPFEFEANGANGSFANMGMAEGLFGRYRSEIDQRLREIGLRCRKLTFRDTFSYPLTGGYSRPQIAPTSLLRKLVQLERLLPQWFFRSFGLRVVIVIEKLPRISEK